ncbi:MAG: PorT family protein [Bacteroidota bacterium]|nr:PorT family protein [Bacteroidota bacterium]
MKKKLATILLLLLVSLSGYSQMSWKVKAGVNISDITNWELADYKPGYQFGVGMDYYFNDHWGIQPSIMLISKGYKSKGDNFNSFYSAQYSNQELKSFDLTDNKVYVELPLLLTYRFDVSSKFKLILSGGGYVSYGIAGKYKRTDTHLDGTTRKVNEDSFTKGVEKFDTGLAAGATLEYKEKYSIGLSGDFGLKSTQSTFKNRTYGLTFGYRF